MGEELQRTRLVGTFIRQRREALGLSQRALGLLFNPPVTTQFISNVERGVTPLPPAHVPTLARALLVSETEVLSLLEREYTIKLSGRLGKLAPESAPGLDVAIGSQDTISPDYQFLRTLNEAYRKSDHKTREAFATVCESIFNMPNLAKMVAAGAKSSASSVVTTAQTGT